MVKAEIRFHVGFRRDRGKWQVSVREGSRRTRKLFETREEAELYGLEAKLGRVDPRPERARWTVRDVLERAYLDVWQHQKDGDGSLVNGELVADLVGRSTPIEDVRAVKVREVFQALQSKGYAPATMNRKLAALRTMFRVAVDHEAIEAAPRVPRMKEPEGRIRFLTESEEARLLSALDEPYRGLAVFLVETGARVGEALGLEWGYVVDGPSVTFRNTKSNRPRVVPLSKRASEVLEARRGAARPFDVPYKAFHAAWMRARKAAGLDEREIVPHIMRHTYATRLVMRGVDLITVQRMLGHADITLTARYAHFAPEGIDKVRQVLDS